MQVIGCQKEDFDICAAMLGARGRPVAARSKQHNRCQQRDGCQLQCVVSMKKRGHDWARRSGSQAVGNFFQGFFKTAQAFFYQPHAFQYLVLIEQVTVAVRDQQILDLPYVVLFLQSGG